MATDRDDARTALVGKLANRLHHRLVGADLLRHIRDKKHGLGRKQLTFSEERALFYCVRQIPEPFALVEQSDQTREKLDLDSSLLITSSNLLFGLLFAAIQCFQIGQHQFRLDDADVANGIDAAADMHHVGSLKTANDMKERIDFADVPKKLITEAFTLACPFD